MAGGATTEVRVALVLNGGVSLAVWMSGIVRELDLLCRASCDEPLPADASAAERRHHATWREITRRAGRRIVVDVIAGTSAGGLNGTILGTALACGKQLPDLKRIWNDSARLADDALLWGTGLEPVPSVLDGGHFATTVEHVLRALRTDPEPVDRDVTLFVTATALGESDLRFRDSAGTEFDVADHRRLYRFRAAEVDAYRPGGGFDRRRVNDFTADDGLAALTCGARASAGFPVAFEPVPEVAALARRRHPAAPPAVHEVATTYLMDGGVLDNAPIEPVIEEIRSRTLDGPVERVLAYVVPSNGTVRRSRPVGGQRPSWTSVVAAGFDMPREADFRHDIAGLVQALGSDRTRVTTSVAMLLRALEGPGERAGLAAAAAALFLPYRANRIEGSLRDMRIGLAQRSLVPPQLRPPTLSGMAFAHVSAPWVPEVGADARRVRPWDFGISGALRCVRVLLGATREHMAADPGALADLGRDLSRVLGRISALQDAVVEQLYEVLRRVPTDGPPGEWNVRAVEEAGKVFADLDVAERLTEQVEQAVAAYAGRRGVDVAQLGEALVGIEIVTGAVSGRSEDQAPPPFAFLRIGPDVPSVLYRDNPTTGADKLYGTRLGHFGAFGEDEWRDRDFTWGRLDAVAHVAALLQLGAEVTEVLEREVVAAEWTDPATFGAGLGCVARNGEEMLAQLRGSAQGRAALQGVAAACVRFLAQPGTRVRVPEVAVRAALTAWARPGWGVGGVVGWGAGRFARRRFRRWMRTGSAGRRVS